MSYMEFYSEKRVTARKPHKCELCGKDIQLGENYWQEKGVFDHKFFHRCLHEHCHGMEAQYCCDIDTEFTWEAIIDHIYDLHCSDCEHSASRDDEPAWTECPYTGVCDCQKIRAIYGGEVD